MQSDRPGPKLFPLGGEVKPPKADAANETRWVSKEGKASERCSRGSFMTSLMEKRASYAREVALGAVS